LISTRLADERPIGFGSGAGLVAPLALGQAAQRLLRSSTPVTLRMCVRFKIRERPKRFGFCNPYFSADEALSELSGVADIVDAYDFSPLGLTHVSARMKLRRGVREDVLLRARAPRRVRRGQRITVRLLLRRRRGEAHRLRIRVRIPRSLRPGERTLVLEGNGAPPLEEDLLEFTLEPELIELFGDEELLGFGGAEPQSIEALIDTVRSFKRPLGITARFRKRGARRVVYKSDKVLFSGSVRVPLRVARKGR
jgi:hypothetical protein